jgi:hypothetical protein
LPSTSPILKDCPVDELTIRSAVLLTSLLKYPVWVKE